MNVLITGSSSGIGRALRDDLLAANHTVVGIARRRQEATDRFFPVELDLSDLDSLPRAMDRLQSTHSPIDAAVCCAGRGHFGTLEQFSPSQIRELIDLDFTSHALVVRSLLPAMKKRRAGRIVLLGSSRCAALKRAPYTALPNLRCAALRKHSAKRPLGTALR